MAKLELKGLKKKYPDFTLELDLEVNEGEFLTIIGPSGSGKSTLLSLISGLEDPDEGQILVDGKDIVKVPVQKRGISMVFQDYALFPNMNVEKNIAYAMKIRKIRKKERKEDVNALLSFVNLPGYNKRKVTTLSGGESQRVALARALSSQPSILLLDEPLSALDAALRRRMRDEIRRIHDENPALTTIYVTHDREEAFSISDRIAVIRSGKIEMTDTPQAVYREPKTLFTAYFTGEGTSLPGTMFNLDIEADTIFFRPEAVTVREGIFYGDSDAFLILENVEVSGAEYLGHCYMLGLQYDGHRILAQSGFYPKDKYITIYIRKTQLIFFKDGSIVK